MTCLGPRTVMVFLAVLTIGFIYEWKKGARMGLSERTPEVAPAASGLLDPRTGRPVGADAPFYVGLNGQLADKGFLVGRY
jgi:hypothetical protein